MSNPDRPIKKQKVAHEPQSQPAPRLGSDSDSDEELPSYMQQKTNSTSNSRNTFIYLDTINRNLLDFDFEKMCLISLATNFVYGCLVCGKYFQGRSPSSHAYNHAINENHHIFVNLETTNFYILPDNYQIQNDEILKYLSDIKLLISPQYTKDDIKNLSHIATAKDLNNKPYHVGYIGLNNISSNDYSNVILQLLVHIPEIRNFYLSLSLPESEDMKDKINRKSILHEKLGLFVRKFWSSHLFKPHISPHELLQFISLSSQKKFTINEQSLPKAFLVWLLNQLHLQLVKATKKSKTVLSETFQGNIEIKTTTLIANDNKDTKKVDFVLDTASTKLIKLKFWLLSLQLPDTSLLANSGLLNRNGDDTGQLPQISLLELLEKYNGESTHQTSPSEVKQYKLLQPLPKYILIHVDRGLEEGSRGSPMVVKYPEIINMAPYVAGANGELNYKLAGNITHQLVNGQKLDRSDDKHQWSISLPKTSDNWVTINNLQIDTCERELLFLKESYIQLWVQC